VGRDISLNDMQCVTAATVTVRGEMTTPRPCGRLVSVLMTLLIVHTLTVVADFGGIRRRLTIGGGRMLHAREHRTPGTVRDGPPVKPEHFRSVEELNKYLADLNEYYTVLGRPRLVYHTSFILVVHRTRCVS